MTVRNESWTEMGGGGGGVSREKTSLNAITRDPPEGWDRADFRVPI